MLQREPAGHREGAAGQLQERWQKSNSSGVSPRYLNLLPCGVNPDTVTVQLQKQDQPILLMPSSFQCPLIKQALARLHNGPHSLWNCGCWWWKSSLPSSSSCPSSPKAKSSLVFLWFPLLSSSTWRNEVKPIHILLICLLLPQITGSSGSNRSPVVSRPFKL